MSITVVAVPFALAQIVTTFITAGASIAAMNALNTNMNKNATDETIHQDSCDDTVVISEANFIEKTFDTPFTDKSILLKTLDEHGFINIHLIEHGEEGLKQAIGRHKSIGQHAAAHNRA